MKRLALLACGWICAAFADPLAYVPYRGGVAVYDTAIGVQLQNIPMPGAAPAGVAHAPDGRRAYFGDVFSNQVYVVDTASNAVLTRLTVPSGPAALAVNAAGTRLAVGSAGTLLLAGSTVTLVDTATHAAVASTQVGLRPAGLLFSADGSRLYVANGESHTVTVHDGETLETLATIPVAAGPLGLALHPSGSRLYVGHIGALAERVTHVTVVDLGNHEVAATIPVGIRPALVRLDPGGTRLYVGNVESDSISVVDTTSHAVIATIPIMQSPTGLDVTPDGNRLYVPMHTNRTAIVDLASGRVTTTFGSKTIVLGRFIAPAAASAANAPARLSGLWWNANEAGWGLSITQRGEKFFLAWYTYDGAGGPKWYVASNCAARDGGCSGTLYEVRGPRFFGAAFDPGAASVRAVGTVALQFQHLDRAILDFSVDSRSRFVSLTRQPIASGPVPGIDYTDLWWNPSESGWGLSVTQQGRVMFLAWFVYDAGGNPVWYVASNCAVNALGTGCSGALYRTTGPAFGPSFNPASVRATEVGSVTLTFTDGNHGMLGYTVNGATGSKAITRQLF